MLAERLGARVAERVFSVTSSWPSLDRVTSPSCWSLVLCYINNVNVNVSVNLYSELSHINSSIYFATF